MAEIEKKWLGLMNKLAGVLDKSFNGEKRPKEWGFFLALFPFDTGPGRFNYISNAKREDIVVLLKEMTAKFEGQPDVEGHA